MSHPDRLSQWESEVSTAFPHLSHPQIWGLVRMSARASRCPDVPESCRSVLCWHECWASGNKRSFSTYASGIWMRSKRVAKSDANWM